MPRRQPAESPAHAAPPTSVAAPAPTSPSAALAQSPLPPQPVAPAASPSVGLVGYLGLGGTAAAVGGTATYRAWLPRHPSPLARACLAVSTAVLAQSTRTFYGSRVQGAAGASSVRDTCCLTVSFALAGASLVAALPAFSAGQLTATLQGLAVALGLSMLGTLASAQLQRAGSSQCGHLLARVEPWATRIEWCTRWPTYFTAAAALFIPGGPLLSVPLWGLVVAHHSANLLLSAAQAFGPLERPACRVDRLLSPLLLASGLGAQAGHWFGRR